MDRRLTVGKVCLTYGVCGIITLQPVFANVVIDNSAGNTSKSTAGNGVEVVNIATPNSQGLSHNQYQQFNVDPSGLILNNSTAQLAQSQLGGILQNNPNLQGQAASVILNEVTGANRSQLEGYTEVFGQQANVILANPYGITCDGCGFINTPRVTLSTGTPDIQNGLVKGFDVAEGSVTIEGLGLDATKQTYFDIISRTAEINASIHANELSVITGNNKVSYQSNQVIEKSQKPTSKPALAIDSSSLGGMYAGRISLVATEDGVGVNVGNLSSSQGAISISADGKVVLGSASSNQNLAVRSQQAITLMGKQTANSNVSLTANQVRAEQTQLVAAKTMAVEADNLTLNGSTFEANLLTTNVDTITLDQPSEITTRSAQLNSLNTLDNQGQLSASEQLSIQGANTELKGTGNINTSVLSTQTDNLTLDTTLRTVSATLEASQQLTIIDQAQLSATQGINISGENLQLDGSLISTGEVMVSANNAVVITGSVSADSAMLNANHLEQHGEITIAQSLNVNTTERFEQGTSGLLEVGTQLAIDTNQLSLGGSTHSNDAIIVTATQASLSGEHQAVNTLSITSDTFEQAAELSANQNVTLTATGQLSNTGNISAGQMLTVTAQRLDNDAQLGAQQDVKLTLSERLLNQSNGLISGQNTQVTAANVDNAGSLQALESLGLNANTLNNTGALVAGTDLIMQIGTTFDNHGVLYAAENANLYSQRLNNYGDIIASQNITIAKNASLEKSNELLNSSATIESRNGYIRVKTHSLRNESNGLQVTTKHTDYLSSIPNGGGTTYTVGENSALAPSFTKSYYCPGGGHSPGCPDIYDYEIIGVEDRVNRHQAYIDETSTQGGEQGSRIIAKNDISIEATDVLNSASMISATNVSLIGNTLKNIGASFSKTVTYYVYSLNKVTKNYYGSSNPISFEFALTGVEHDTSYHGQVSSSITASNNVTINVGSQVNNSTIQSNAAKVTPSNNTKSLAPTTHANVPDSISLTDLNNIPFPDFRLPTNPNGLFIYSDGPSSRYLIETNPLLTDMGQYLGSDYFQQSVGFNPERDVTFLGDALYDTRIITQAIFDQTGQRYLSNEIGSDLSQMQQLIDAAVEQKSSLNLEAGVSLSQEQIDRLTNDIIWYEPVLIDGREVLAPKLYIANFSERDFTSGVVISGKNIAIDAGDFENSGSIRAERVLALTSEDKILNDTGSLQVGGDLFAEAKGNIENLSGSIAGDNVSLVSHEGDIVNKTLSDQLNVDSKGRLKNSLSSDAVFTDTYVGDRASIASKGKLTVSAGGSITNVASQIESAGDATLDAGKDITFTSIENKQYKFLDALRRLEEQSEVHQIGSQFSSGGALNLNAANNVNLKASKVRSTSSVEVNAGNSVAIESALNDSYNRYQDQRHTQIDHLKQHQQSSISGDGIKVNAGKNITLKGSQIVATNSVDISAKGDVNILAVNDSSYHFDQTVSKKSFGRSSTTTNEIYREKVKGSDIQAGQNIHIKAQNLEAAVTAGGESDINLVGSELNAGGEVTLSADGDVTLTAQSYKEFERHETVKKGFGGLSGRNTGSASDATLLNGSYLINSGNTSIVAGKDIGVIASEVSSGGNINLNAVDEVLIAAGDVLRQTQQWDEKTSFLSGGNLFEMEKKRQGLETSTAQSSVLQSGGNLSVDAGAIKVIGSELTADENVSLAADTGDVEILAAKETSKRFESEEKLSIGLGTTTKMLMGDTRDVVKVEDGTIKASLGKATYDKVKQRSDAVNHKGSVVSAQNDLSIEAESSILVEGSTLASDTDGDNQGDLRLTANDDITIKEAIDTLTEQREEVHGKAEVSVVVQHQAVEVAKAALALKDATKKLKQAKEDFKQYQKQLDSLESTLTTLEQEYQAKKPGVLFEDVEELRDLISEVKSDKAWYVAGVALASEDVVSKTTLLVQQAAAAAQSTGTYGFNAGLHLDVEASKTKASAQQTTSVDSQLSGQNIIVRAGDNEGNQANISGSTLAANDNLEVAANEVNIIASQDTDDSKSETQSGKIGASITVYGASSGINLNASFDRSQNTSSSLTHNNSQLNADNITITSVKDTNVKGATVNADESLTMNVGGDLNVSSVQDRYSSGQKGMGISGGLSLSDGATSEMTGASGGVNASNGRTRTKHTVVTSLTSSGTADINVANNTDLKGAVIATQNDAGKDTGQLNLTTNTFTFADLSNTDYNQNRSMGVSTSVGVNDGEIDSTNNSTSIQYKNTSGYSKSKTLATIGQGNLTISDSDNSHDLTALNRDIEQTEKDLFTVNRKQGDFDVTVDHRLLTEKGRNQIAEDILITDMFRETVERIITTDKLGVEDFFSETGKQVAVYEGIKEKIASDPELAAKLSDPNATAAEKELILDKLTHSTLVKLGYEVGEYENKIIAKDDSNFKGFYSKETGDSYVNDSHANNTEELVETAGHELSHRIDDLEGDNTKYSEADRETYAEHFESDYGDYTEMALAINGHDGMASSNGHVGNNSKPVIANNREFSALDKTKGDALPVVVVPVVVSSVLAVGAALSDPKTRDEAVAAINKGFNDAKDSVKELGNSIGLTWDNLIGADGNADIVDHFTSELSTLQAQVEIAHAEGNVDRVNELYGRIGEVSYLLEQQPSKVISGVQEKLAQGGLTANTGGSKIVENNNTTYINPIDEGYDSSTVSEAGGSVDASTETVVTTEQGIGSTESPVESGVDPLLVVASTNPSNVGGTGKDYDSENGQGLYVLYDESGQIKYVGRGDAPSRLAVHENSVDKDELIGEILFTNNLTKAQAKGLEQALIDHYGGALSQDPETPLLNKIRSYSQENPNAGNYKDAATQELLKEALKRIGK